jgi:hypothetical protein
MPRALGTTKRDWDAFTLKATVRSNWHAPLTKEDGEANRAALSDFTDLQPRLLMRLAETPAQAASRSILTLYPAPSDKA